MAQPFPQPALEPDWIARLLLSRLEATARVRRSGVRPQLPYTNQDGLSEGTRPANLDSRLPNLRKSLASDGSHGLEATDHLPKATTIGTWQEQQTEERQEPRIASVTLAFDRLSDPATRQLPAFEARAGRWEELRWSLERIRHRFGEGRLWRATNERPKAALPEHRSRLVDIGQ